MAKLDKGVVLYFTADEIGDSEGACCKVCRHFLTPDKCTEVEGKINGPNGICGLYAHGEHLGQQKEPDVSKQSSGYAENGPTHCGNCMYYGGGSDAEGPCQIVTGTVEFEGCCNAWKKLETEKQINRENYRPKDEAGEGIKRPVKLKKADDDLIALLNQALATQYSAHIRYKAYADLLTGPYAETIASRLEEIAGDEEKHAGELRDRIIALGSIPEFVIEEKDFIEATTLDEMLDVSIQGEEEAIDLYHQVLDAVDKDNILLYRTIENIIMDEQEHYEELTRFKEGGFLQKAKVKRKVEPSVNVEDQTGSGSGVEKQGRSNSQDVQVGKKKKRQPGEPVNTEGEAGVEYSLEKAFDPDKKRSEATLGDWVEIQHARPPKVFRQNVEKFLGTTFHNIKILKQANPSYRSNLVRFALHNGISPDEIEKEAHYESWGSEEPIPVERVLVDTGTEVFEGLANGYLFLTMKDGSKLVLSMMQGYAGASSLEIYTADKDTGVSFLKKINDFITDNNYLKGKRLLSNGQFLKVAKTTWDDVVLSEDMKHVLQTYILGYMANIEELKKLGLPTKRGLLIIGPPGNGKTMIGKALAWNSTSTFIWVPSSSDYSHVYLMARELAPSIVFIEDIAAHGGLDRRAGPVSSDTAELLNMLDGVEANDLVLTVATENNFDLLDPALRNRPGRFDLIVPLPNPDVDLREKLLKHYLLDTPSELIAYAADQTTGYSGAHLRELATRIILEKASTPEEVQDVIDGISTTFGVLNDQENEKELNEASVAGLYRMRNIDRGPRHSKTKYKKPSAGLNPPSDPGDATGKAKIKADYNDDDLEKQPMNPGMSGNTSPIPMREVVEDRKKKKKEKGKDGPPSMGTNPGSSPPPITVNVGSGVANLGEDDSLNDLQASWDILVQKVCDNTDA